MIRSATPTFAAFAFSQDAAQPHSHPAVDWPEGRLVAMFEIAKPASQNVVQLRDNHRHARSACPRRLFPDSLFKLVQALLPWPSHPALEVIPQKVKPAL